MKRYLPIIVLIAAVQIGCEDHAEKMLNVDTSQGKMALRFAGSNDSLESAGKIDSHRQFQISDGTLIDLWIIQASPDYTIATKGKPKGTVLLIHDLGSSKASMLSLGKKVSDLGYDVVMPDLRAHGRSTGLYCTYGAKEKTDLASVMGQLIREQQVDPTVTVFGREFGGSVAVLYAATDTEHCQGVVAMQPYVGPRTILDGSMQFNGLDDDELTEVMQEAADKGDFKLTETSAVQAARRITCPLLVLKRDGVFVSDVDGQAIYEAANSPKLMEDVGGMDLAMTPNTFLSEKIDDFISGRLEVPGRISEPPSPGDVLSPID